MKLKLIELHPDDGFYPNKEAYLGVIFEVPKDSDLYTRDKGNTCDAYLHLLGWSRGNLTHNEQDYIFHAAKFEEVQDAPST